MKTITTTNNCSFFCCALSGQSINVFSHPRSTERAQPAMPLLAAADCPRPQCANAFATQTQQQGRERSRFQCSTLSPPPQFHQHTAIWSWSSMVDLDRHEPQVPNTHTAEERDVSTRHQHSTRPPPPARFSMRRPAEREELFLCGLSGPSFFLPAVKNYNFSSPMNVCVLSVPARASMSIGHDDASKTKGHHSSSSRSRRSEENPMRCGGSCDGA